MSWLLILQFCSKYFVLIIEDPVALQLFGLIRKIVYHLQSIYKTENKFPRHLGSWSNVFTFIIIIRKIEVHYEK